MLSPDVFKRVGADGNEVILPLCGGDEFVGEVLEGQWKKDYETGIVIFTARINGVATGMLEMGGESNAGGTLRWGWINNHHPFVMMNEAELEVELEIPTSDTGVAATEDIFFEFYIRRQKELITPTDDPDFIRVRFNIDENGLLMELHKRISPAAAAPLWDGSTADGNDGADPAGDKFWIFRFVFHDAVAGADSPEDLRHMHVYATHAATRVGLDTATEEELIDTVGDTQSPYAINDLLFNVGYPAYQIISAHTTWFGQAVGSGDEAISTYLRTSYPTLFALKYDFDDYGYGDVELWDMKGSVTDADFQQVFDEDHYFGTYDIVLQNGLVRLLVDRIQQYGLEFYYWNGAAWVQPFDQLYFHAVTSAKDLSYPVIRSIESISPEKTAIVVRLLDSATVNDDYYVDLRITLDRGKYSIKIDSLDVFPDQDMRFRFLNTTTVRFGSIGDDDIGDDDADVTGNNITLTDNFLIAFDDAGTAILGAVCTDEKPTGGNARFQASDGGYLVIEDIDASDTAGTIIWVTLIPFPLVAGLFLEAEDSTVMTGARYFGEPAGASTHLEAFSDNGGDTTQTLTIIGRVGGVRTTDTIALDGVNVETGSVDFDRVYILKLDAATAGNITVQDSIPNLIHTIPAATTHVDNAVILNAADEYVRLTFTGITNLPKGRYVAAWRMRDTTQSSLDVKRWVKDMTAPTWFLNEENNNVFKTVTAAYLYYTLIFDITEKDAGGTLEITTQKLNIAANDIYIDYILIIPICEGEDWPQDAAHGALRTFTKPRRLYVR